MALEFCKFQHYVVKLVKFIQNVDLWLNSAGRRTQEIEVESLVELLQSVNDLMKYS